jgi:hypothetical protein
MRGSRCTRMSSLVVNINAVTEGLYLDAIDLLLDRIDQAPAHGAPNDDDTTSIFENWPIEFRTEALRYRPKWRGCAFSQPLIHNFRLYLSEDYRRPQ